MKEIWSWGPIIKYIIIGFIFPWEPQSEIIKLNWLNTILQLTYILNGWYNCQNIESIDCLNLKHNKNGEG